MATVEAVKASNPAFILNSLEIRMVWIKPGKFLMGSPEDEPGRDPDETQHEVELTKGFYIAATQVTQMQWWELMQRNPSSFKNKPKFPVDRVSYEAAVEFCAKLTEKENKRSLSLMGIFKKPIKRVYRLPTEAEWEYACRSGLTYPFSFGRGISPDQANYNGTMTYGTFGKKGANRGTPVDVGSFKPNPWGLWDMHGNCFEWCSDWYGPYLKPKELATDPAGPEIGDLRVVRGGSWYTGPDQLRSAARNALKPDNRANDVTLRLAMDLVQD